MSPGKSKQAILSITGLAEHGIIAIDIQSPLCRQSWQ